MPIDSTVPVVYILGAGHSGSTLLAMLLGSHPGICTIGEVKWLGGTDPASYRCSCGQTLAECAFWDRLATELRSCHPPLQLFGGPSDIRRSASAYERRLLRPLHRGRVIEALRDRGLRLSPSWHEHSRRVRAFTAAVSRGACRVSNRRVFVDSSKTGLQLKYLLRNPELDVKAIRLVRDARGVALSYRKADGLPIPEAAFKWKRSNEEAAAVVGQLEGGRWFDLRYEDLCRDAAATLRRLFAFIGVDSTRSVTLLPPDAQHVLGNDRMRLEIGEIRLDEKWRRELTRAELEGIENISGSLNRSLGYE